MSKLQERLTNGLLATLTVACIWSISRSATRAEAEPELSYVYRTELVEVHKPLDDWHTLTLAVIQTESEFDYDAVGTKGDLGILQITDIMLEDFNRIVGHQKYTKEQLFDPEVSIEIWNVVQNHYNPEHEIDKAIRLWNPTAGDWYAKRVKQNMEYISNIESIVHILN